jgi:hypothetical protein
VLLVTARFRSQFIIKSNNIPALGNDATSTKGACDDNGALHMDSGNDTLGASVLNMDDLDVLASSGDAMTAADILRAGNGAILVAIDEGLKTDTPMQESRGHKNRATPMQESRGHATCAGVLGKLDRSQWHPRRTRWRRHLRRHQSPHVSTSCLLCGVWSICGGVVLSAAH